MAKSIAITITQNSQNVTNNTSNVTITCKITTSGESYRGSHRTGTCTINGTAYSFTSGAPANSTTTLFTKTLDIPHNSDGTKTLSVSCNYDSGWCTASKSQALTTIARESKFGTVSGVTMDGNMTINITRNSSSFTHSLWYHFGSKTWQSIGTGIGTSTTFKIPLSLASEIPNATYGDMTLVLRTFNGSTQIGKDQTVAYRVHVPDTVIPTVSAISVSEATSGIASQFGCYVKNKSKLSVKITASGSYGSTIKSYSTGIGATNYSGASFTSGLLTTAGTVEIDSYAKDSRGRSGNKKTSITVVDYENPTISNFTVERCLQDGTLDDEGTYVKYTYSHNISPVNEKNTSSVKVQYLNGDTWTDLATSTAYSSDGASGVTTKTFSVDNTYQFRLYVADWFTYITNSKTLPSSFTLINFNASGKGIAFGKVSEANNFDVDLPVVLRKGYGRYPVNNTISTVADDTVDNWDALGNSVHYYNVAGCITDQPTQYGLLLNYTNGAKNVHQIWLSQPSGTMYHRGGNANGWSTGWVNYIDRNGGVVSSDISVIKSTTSDTMISVQNSNGSVALLTSSNRGLYDITSVNWIIYRNASTGQIWIPSVTNISGGGSTVGSYRFNPSWLGFYADNANAQANTNRKGWIGHDGTNHLNIVNNLDGNIVLDSKHIGFKNGQSTIWFDSVANNSTYVGYFYPNVANKVTCGSATYRWYRFYGAYACDISSDVRLKTNLIKMDSEMSTFLSGDNTNLFRKLHAKLNPYAFSFISEEGTENEGKMHFGYLAQDVVKALQEIGLDEQFGAFLSHNYWTDEETGEEKDEYGLCYEEFVALNTFVIQEQQKEIDELKDTVKAQQKQIEDLTNLVNQLLHKEGL